MKRGRARRAPRPRPNALFVLRDLVLGGRHCRRTVAALGVSLPTADRWLKALLVVPGVRKRRISKTTWFEWVPVRDRLRW